MKSKMRMSTANFISDSMHTINVNFIQNCIVLYFAFSISFAQKPTYQGKYCGMLQESQAPGKFRYYNCYGVVWAMDERRVKLTSFTFQQSFFLPENITLWIGPAVKTGNELLDIIPSGNGYYLEAKVAPQKLPPIAGIAPFIIAKRPTVQEVSLIKLRQNNINNSSTTSVTLSKTETSASTVSLPTTKQQIIRVPRESAVAEKQPVPAAEPTKKVSDSVVPVPESSPKSTSDKSFVPVPEPAKNHSDTVSVAEPTHNPTKVEFESDQKSNAANHIVVVDEAETGQRSNLLNHIVVADAAESVQRISKPDEKLVVSDKEIADKIVYEHPFNKNQGQLLLDSTQRVTISLLLANNNNTSPYNLITHGTVSGQFSSTTTLPIVSTSFSSSTTNLSNHLESNSTNETAVVASSDEEILFSNVNRVWKPLSWYSGGDEIILDLPYKKRLSDFRWLSVYDHTNQQSIATLLLPNGKGFFVPAPLSLKGFKPTLRTKDVHSGAIQILDTKTIKINNFTFEGDAPGAWFMVGTSLFPTLSGHMVPILRNDGKYDCDYLQAFSNQTLILKLPGTMEASDVFWLSVFCVPYSISFAHVYLPYKDLSVPISASNEPVPHCMLEGTI